MRTEASGRLAQQRTRFKHCANKKIKSLPALPVGQMVDVYRPQPVTFAADHEISANYNTLMQRTTRPFKVLEVRDQILAVDENRLENSIATDRAAPSRLATPPGVG